MLMRRARRERCGWLAVVVAVAGCAAASAVARGQCTGYAVTQTSGASLDPGSTDIGNHGDDQTTQITLPFAVSMYGNSYTTANASSNGNLQFTTNSNAYSNVCLNAPGMGVMIAPHWDDLRTDGTGEGIFTSVAGTAPNRVLNVEWRSHYFSGTGTANFEVRLFENGSHFEIVYGNVDQAGASATVGVQNEIVPPVQFECNSGAVVSGLKLSYACTNLPIPPTGAGGAAPGTLTVCGNSVTTLLTVAVTPGLAPTSTGLTVTADLSSIGGSAAQALYDDGTHGDTAAGNNTFSFLASIPGSVVAGNKSIPFSITDAQGRSGSGAIGLTLNPCPVAGPDVFVARITDVGYYGAVGGISAYAVGTDACNNGDTPVQWTSSNNHHPVIAQNFFRLKNGRFEQLGQSWLKHGFSSTNSGTCGACVSPPGGSTQLGVGCSDAYGSGLNGSQNLLGPRSQVNATFGAYPYPFSAPSNYDATIGRRLQVFTTDIDPAQNQGASYYADVHYVTSDDATWALGAQPGTNGLNNCTYQQITIPSTTGTPALVSSPQRMSPGIQAWKDADPTVQLVAADYVDASAGPPGIVARFWIACKATNNGNGTWHYEYAAYNLNADRSGGSFSVALPAGVIVSNIGFHGVFAHSGEPYPNTAANPDNWTAAVTPSAITWTCPEPYVAPGDNANALRWGTMYNFRFDASTPPTTQAAGSVTLGLFKPGTPTGVSVALSVPTAGCGPDYNGDNALNVQDIFDFLNGWFASNPRADYNHANGITVQDIFDFLAAWFTGC